MRVWTFGLLALGCGAAPLPARAPAPTTVAVAPPADAADQEPAAPTGPVVLDDEGERARWLDPPTPVGGRKRWVHDTLLAAGDHASISRTSSGEYFGFDEALGVVGPLELPPETKRVLFGPADSVLVVTRDGVLLAAPSLSAAKSAQAFEARSAPAGALSWDSAGGYLVATDGKQVHLSRDGGKTWSVTKSAAWGSLRTVVVRFDGVMAALGGPAKTPVTFLSRDDGKSWQRSSFQPDRLSRSGSFIWSDVWNCTAVLSENGSTWSKGSAELSRFRGMRTWTTSFGTSSTPEGFVAGAHRSLSDPPPPKVPAAKDRRAGRGCPPPPGATKSAKQAGILGLLGTGSGYGISGVLSAGGDAFGSLEGIGTLGTGVGGLGHGTRSLREPTWGSCSGTTCLRPHPPEEQKTRTRFELFRDGRCSVPGSGRSCGDSFERLPHVSVLDESTGKRRVADLPKGCAPLSLVSVAGLGILTCRGSGGPSVFVADSSGAFKEEGTIPEAAMTKWPVAIAKDGSLLFQEACAEKKPCRALCRRPVEPGVKGAWRSLSVTDAAGYRVLTRGRVLAIARGSDGKKADFFLSEPGKADTPLARGIALEGDMMDVRIDDKGRVVVRERRDKTQSESFVVGVDGQRHSAD